MTSRLNRASSCGIAAKALGCYAQLVPGDVPEFTDARSDPDPFVRWMACEFLPHRPGTWPAAREALTALAACETDLDERARRSAKAVSGVISGETADHR